MFQIANPRDLTEAEIDELLERFDQTDRALQRKMIARLMTDRTLLLDAAEKVVQAPREDWAEMFFMLEAVVHNVRRK